MNYNITSKTFRDLEYIKEYESFCSRMGKCRVTLSTANNSFQRSLIGSFSAKFKYNIT